MGKITDEIIGEELRKQKEDPLTIGVNNFQGDILIRFSRELKAIRMSKSDARQFATKIIKEALK